MEMDPPELRRISQTSSPESGTVLKKVGSFFEGTRLYSIMPLFRTLGQTWILPAAFTFQMEVCGIGNGPTARPTSASAPRKGARDDDDDGDGMGPQPRSRFAASNPVIYQYIIQLFTDSSGLVESRR